MGWLGRRAVAELLERLLLVEAVAARDFDDVDHLCELAEQAAELAWSKDVDSPTR